MKLGIFIEKFLQVLDILPSLQYSCNSASVTYIISDIEEGNPHEQKANNFSVFDICGQSKWPNRGKMESAKCRKFQRYKTDMQLVFEPFEPTPHVPNEVL